MSQMVTRKSHVGDDKEKRQTDSPVKDMKKKLAANAEKEKQAAEKNVEKSTPNEKQAEKSDKSAEKKEKDKHTEKVDKKDKDKSLDKADKKEKDKSNEKVDKKENKTLDKKEKAVEKTPEKKDKADKKESQPEKAKDENKDKPSKAENSEDKKKNEEKAKQNGAKVHNGEQNGDTVSSEDEDLDIERDEMFPELTYEDSDLEGFEAPTPEGLPSRSYTRRSQVKVTRTPETPRPASDKVPESGVDDSKEKVLKLKEDATSSTITDRKLRSADSPKPDKKDAKKGESPKKAEEKRDKEEEDKGEEIDVVVVDVDNEDEPRKPDTNYSRSRVKVSPYRRSLRQADLTISSTAANYTGNNTTMEMDITETSLYVAEDAPESPYLSGLRTIRGRRSYKPLKEMNLRNLVVNRSTRSTASTAANESGRPTGTVVGRKRKPESDGAGGEPEGPAGEDVVGHGGASDSKRPRLLHRLTRPFRTLATPRHAEIVGINTDLPLTAPVACSDVFDPEAIKPETGVEATTLLGSQAALPNLSAQDRQTDSRRCIVM